MLVQVGASRNFSASTPQTCLNLGLGCFRVLGFRVRVQGLGVNVGT